MRLRNANVVSPVNGNTIATRFTFLSSNLRDEDDFHTLSISPLCKADKFLDFLHSEATSLILKIPVSQLMVCVVVLFSSSSSCREFFFRPPLFVFAVFGFVFSSIREFFSSLLDVLLEPTRLCFGKIFDKNVEFCPVHSTTFQPSTSV